MRDHLIMCINRVPKTLPIRFARQSEDQLVASPFEHHPTQPPCGVVGANLTERHPPSIATKRDHRRDKHGVLIAQLLPQVFPDRFASAEQSEDPVSQHTCTGRLPRCRH
ncbi:hypothetical protein [Nocardia sp. CDC160]|uniref:hypothetical protein n=1 Tax=Nocardia sp. CDC160 TaxID=3112166 RepID=UPI002DBA4420|nr:hypothetical protein [Nocardia sp. CDC160]MEC3920205.1 hypothetical protein [Nocardia sp. CDC160]